MARGSKADKAAAADRSERTSYTSRSDDYWDRKEQYARDAGIDYSRPERTSYSPDDRQYWEAKERAAREAGNADYSRPESAPQTNVMDRVSDFLSSPFEAINRGLGRADTWMQNGRVRDINGHRMQTQMPGAVRLAAGAAMPGPLGLGVGALAGFMGNKVADKHEEVAGQIAAGEEGYSQMVGDNSMYSFHPGIFGSTVMTGGNGRILPENVQSQLAQAAAAGDQAMFDSILQGASREDQRREEFGSYSRSADASALLKEAIDKNETTRQKTKWLEWEVT